MKKVLLSLVVLAVSSVTTFAQISGGIKAGVNFANQKVSADGFSITPDARTAFHAGVYVNIGLAEKMSIQPELLYNSVGSEWDGSEIKVDYLSLPIMFKYNVAPIVNLQAGPQFGFVMSADAEGEDIKDLVKGTDLGFGLGAGVDLPMGLNFTARYIFGLSNIGEDEFFDGATDASLKNNVFQLSVGYRIFGGK